MPGPLSNAEFIRAGWAGSKLCPGAVDTEIFNFTAYMEPGSRLIRLSLSGGCSDFSNSTFLLKTLGLVRQYAASQGLYPGTRVPGIPAQFVTMVNSLGQYMQFIISVYSTVDINLTGYDSSYPWQVVVEDLGPST
jgi:hypothetical protein